MKLISKVYMGNVAFILILTLLGSTGQSGKAIHTQEFLNKQSCEAAAAAWLASLPTKKQDGDNYYDFSGPPRALCVQK